MDEKDLVEGMREYISLLQKEGRYSSAKSYQDAMNSFIRYSGTDRIPYTYINKDTLRRYEAYLLEKGCMRNTVSTYIRRLRCIYNKAVENGEAAFIPSLFKGGFYGCGKPAQEILASGRFESPDDCPGKRREVEEDTADALLDVSIWGDVVR